MLLSTNFSDQWLINEMKWTKLPYEDKKKVVLRFLLCAKEAAKTTYLFRGIRSLIARMMMNSSKLKFLDPNLCKELRNNRAKITYKRKRIAVLTYEIKLLEGTNEILEQENEANKRSNKLIREEEKRKRRKDYEKIVKGFKKRKK